MALRQRLIVTAEERHRTRQVARVGQVQDHGHVDNDSELMRRALALAARSGDTRPNPRVGCVVVDSTGSVVGTGAHPGPGQPHAEVLALRRAGGRARGGTAYVSLEPCDHFGRTGPCTRALTEAGVARVVHAQSDPNPQAAGGATTLREHGIEVTGGLLAGRAEAINAHWSFAMRHRRPFVLWKVAATLDGRVAAADGSSRWITGNAVGRQVHELRAEADAVVVGTGTLLIDDPALTARTDGARQPDRIVVGLRDVPPTARVRAPGAGVLGQFRHVRTRDPHVVVRELFAHDAHFVLLEGGPGLATAFLREGLVDSIRWYVAPALLGGGVSAVADLGGTSMDHIRRFTVTASSRVGTDVRIDLGRTRED